MKKNVGISCSAKTFKLLSEGLSNIAEENNVSHEEFIAFVIELPRYLLGDRYKDVVYVPGDE